MSDPNRLPRLGDREGLRIDVMPAAIESYRASVREAFARATEPRELSAEEARAELDDVLRNAIVRYSSGDTMRVRARVRRLAVDVEAVLTRVTSDHVRCIHARARRLDTRATASGSGRGGGAYDERAVLRSEGRGRLGYLRARDGAIEWRPIAEAPGAAPPPWEPVPDRIRVLADEQARAGHPGLQRWLAEHERGSR